MDFRTPKDYKIKYVGVPTFEEYDFISFVQVISMKSRYLLTLFLCSSSEIRRSRFPKLVLNYDFLKIFQNFKKAVIEAVIEAHIDSPNTPIEEG